MGRKVERVILALILLSLWPIELWAQESDDLIAFTWDAADIDLGYPAGWDEPLPGELNGRPVLDIAQTLVDSPEARPPGIPSFQLILISDALPEADLESFLAEALQSLGITPTEQTSITLVGIPGLAASGLSTDQSLFGASRAVQLPDNRVFIMSGRVLAVQRDVFLQIFETIASSIEFAVDLESTVPEYGVLWHTERNPADDLAAFVNLAGAAYTSNGWLYSADAELGLLRLDAATGEILATFPNEELTAPTDVTVDAQGRVYVADGVCGCIAVLNAGETWDTPILGFGVDAPYSLVIGGDGSLYATSIDDAGMISVRVFREGSDQTQISLGAEQVAQPLLGVDRDGRIIALTIEGSVLALENNTFIPLFQLADVPPQANDITFDLSNNLLIATSDQGILVVDSSGTLVDRLGRIVASSPLPGEVVVPRGVAVGDDGTIYITDSDGSFGAITALSTRVPRGRIGSTALVLGVAVQGTLDGDTPQQTWTFQGTAGQQVTISAVDSSRQEALDLSLRLLGPDGNEETSNDNQEGEELFGLTDAQISNYTLQSSGTYAVVVERVSGEGEYALGISQPQPLALSTDTVTRVDGEIADVFPTQKWTFEGTAGQVFTMTMQAESGSLDSLLRLIGPGDIPLAENDDADDPAISPNAQLVQVQLPVDGMYTIEATRFEGEGRYSLVIVATA